MDLQTRTDLRYTRLGSWRIKVVTMEVIMMIIMIISLT